MSLFRIVEVLEDFPKQKEIDPIEIYQRLQVLVEVCTLIQKVVGLNALFDCKKFGKKMLVETKTSYFFLTLENRGHNCPSNPRPIAAQ